MLVTGPKGITNIIVDDIDFKKVTPINAELLEFAGAVPFGSRALDVATAKSDYDFAISAKNAKNLNLDSSYKIDPAIYFKYLPCIHKSVLYYKVPTTDNNYLDLLVLPTDADVLTVSKSISFLKNSTTKKTLKNKYSRIQLYERQLAYNGWCTPLKGLICSLKKSLWNWLKQLLNQLTFIKLGNSDFHRLKSLIRQKRIEQLEL